MNYNKAKVWQLMKMMQRLLSLFWCMEFIVQLFKKYSNSFMHYFQYLSRLKNNFNLPFLSREYSRYFQ